MTDELSRMQQQVADEVSRREAARWPRPEWRVALEDLCIANYGNPDFWVHLRAIAMAGGGDISDDDLARTRQFYAKKCRICGRPISRRRVRCDVCGAGNQDPEVITGTVITDVAAITSAESSGHAVTAGGAL